MVRPPSSSSHALIGGLIGAGLARGGLDVLVWKGIAKTASFIVFSPVIGMIWTRPDDLVLNLTRFGSVSTSNMLFRRRQLVSAAVYSVSHGMNAAQKTIGIIALVLFSGGYLGPTFRIPFWVIIACYTVIALGTMSGGWRIVKTMGTKITKLQPMGGFCAETAAAVSIRRPGGFREHDPHDHGAIMGLGPEEAVRRPLGSRGTCWAGFSHPDSGVLSPACTV